MVSIHTIRRTLAALAVGALFVAGSAQGQNMPTASRSAQVQVFGLYTHTHPDYGTQDAEDNGFTLGGSFDLRPYLLSLAPGLEFRVMHGTGDEVDLTNYALGPRLQLHMFGAIQPYAGFEWGAGKTHLNPKNTTFHDDTEYTKSLPVGVDLGITHKWGIRGEYVKQWWSAYPPDFQPWSASLGVRFRPFGSRPH